MPCTPYKHVLTVWCLQVGKPHELSPKDLSTLGEGDLDGQIKDRLAGHYRVVTEKDGSQRCVTFGTQVRTCRV